MPFSFQQLTISKVHAHVCSAARDRWMQPHLPAAGRLHLDALWWTAGAETSERGIHRRAYHVRSSRLPSLPQLSRSYDLPPPPRPRLAHSGCPQSRAAPPVILRSDAGSCPQCCARMGRPQRRPSCARRDLTPFSWLTSCILRPPTVLHAVAATINGDDLGMMQEPVEQGRGKHLVSEQLSPSGKAGVGGEQDGAMLIASGDQLKEMVRLSC